MCACLLGHHRRRLDVTSGTKLSYTIDTADGMFAVGVVTYGCLSVVCRTAGAEAADRQTARRRAAAFLSERLPSKRVGVFSFPLSGPTQKFSFASIQVIVISPLRLRISARGKLVPRITMVYS